MLPTSGFFATVHMTQQKEKWLFQPEYGSQLQAIELNSTNYFDTVLSCRFSYLPYSVECVRCLHSNRCHDMYLEHDAMTAACPINAAVMDHESYLCSVKW